MDRLDASGILGRLAAVWRSDSDLASRLMVRHVESRAIETKTETNPPDRESEAALESEGIEQSIDWLIERRTC